MVESDVTISKAMSVHHRKPVSVLSHKVLAEVRDIIKLSRVHHLALATTSAEVPLHVRHKYIMAGFIISPQMCFHAFYATSDLYLTAVHATLLCNQQMCP